MQDHITAILKNAGVLSMQPMSEHLKEQGKAMDFSGEVWLATLEGGVQAVFKTPYESLDADAEVAAYKASVFLGFPHVPPTVVRTIDGIYGSLQLYIDTNIDLLVDDNYNKVLKCVKADEIDKLNLFYFIFGQWDTGPHNLLAYTSADETHLVAIDNSGIKNRQNVLYGNLPYVRLFYNDAFNTDDFDQPFPFSDAETITADEMKKRFGNKLPETFYENHVHSQNIRFVLYKNSIWIQYHASDDDFMKSYVARPSDEMLAAIRKIDLQALHDIFGERADEFDLQGILDRRDQVLSSDDN